MFKAEGMDTSEDFWIRYYNGSTWTTIATFTSGTNFVNNQLYTATVTITGTLSNVSRFRFQCDASENDDNVHIDAVIITASTGSGMVNNSLTITTLPEIVSFNESVYDDFLIYPNPVDDILKIKSSDEIKKVKVYNLSGQLIMSEGQGFETQIDMSNFDSGMYLLRIETEDNIYSKRIVKK